ncbi:MAG TPA: serine/threonine-protein kinase, partial [Polyangiaceae bacterium]|nr:serine/threonine-protein kinase [Polyangiaceae bacterium]
ESAARFLREARAASRITSEHVVRVTDLGKHPSGVPYMVMEFLDGSDLAVLLQLGGPLPIATAVDYAMQAMEALAEAHRQGVVHRDLKPSNLFVTRRADGSALVKVLDFGISKATQLPGTIELTNSAVMIGSPLYMAPEQIRSAKDLDARADIWSLGVVLYELLTGKRPFQAETHSAVLAAIVSDPPWPLRALRPDVPPRIEAIIMRCLAKLPHERFENVAALAVELAPFGGPSAALSAARIQGVLARLQVNSNSLPHDPYGADASETETTEDGKQEGWDSSGRIETGRARRGMSSGKSRFAAGAALLLLGGIVGRALLTEAPSVAQSPSAATPVVEPPRAATAPELAVVTTAVPPAPATSAEHAPPSASTVITRPSATRPRRRPPAKPAPSSDDSALSHR